MRISDWSSDVCSSDLGAVYLEAREAAAHGLHGKAEIVGNVAPCHRQRDRTGRPAPALLTRGDLKQKGRDLLHRGLAAQKRSEEHTSEPVTNAHLVCRLLLEKKKQTSAHRTLTRNSNKH